ncbi:chemotaxis protein [soil metagenome]
MILWFRLAAALLGMALQAAALHAEERAIPPYEMARSLQMLQEDVARGNRATLAAQQTFLTLMTTRFLATDPEAWKDPKNVAAVIVHALSGGDPKVLKTLLEKNLIGESDQALAKGTLAYAEGRIPEATELLAPIDARTLLPSLGGYVALTQASLAMEKDPKLSQRMLDTARLLLPGSLIEEGALRREILLVAKDGDVETFERLARNELTRFSTSVYGAVLRTQFAEAVVQLDYGASVARLPMLADVLRPLDPSIQEELYLAIARKALIRGKTVLARFAADQVRQLKVAAKTDDPRAQLYEAAAALVTEDFDEGYRKLKALRRDDFDPGDRDILDRALILAQRMRAWPPVGEDPPVRNNPHQADEPGDKTGSIAAIVGRAEKAITETDDLLKALAE